MLLALALLLPLACRSEPGWPSLQLPPEVQAFDMGQQVILNGLPMRLTGFVSQMPLSLLAARFRALLGSPVVENRLGNKRILGHGQDGYYLMVQLEPAGRAGSGTRGVLAISHPQAAYANRDDTRADARRWLARLPAGSRLLSDMRSRDGPRLSRQLLIVNEAGPVWSRDRVKALLAEEGYAMAGETANADHGALLFFTAPGKQAIATVHADARGHSVVLLNVVTVLEPLR